MNNDPSEAPRFTPPEENRPHRTDRGHAGAESGQYRSDARSRVIRDYTESLRQRSEAFQAYRDLGLTPPSGSEADDFNDRYLGSWPDRPSFIQARLDELGWTQAVTEFAKEQGMWPGDLAWDDGVLWDYFADRYHLAERPGGIHAFRV